MLKAELQGREALSRRLNQIAPKVEQYAAEAKLEIAKDAAERIRASAPRDRGDYAASIEGGRLADHPGKQQIGVNASKDKDAAGVFADFTWRFIEFGTQAHVIRSKTGKRMFFQAKNGSLVSTKQVKHPGSHAQPHIFPTWRAMKKKARRKLLAAVNKGVREAMGKT